MMTTIEDKLSAIKAINEEMQMIEEQMERLAFIKSNWTLVSVNVSCGEKDETFFITRSTGDRIAEILHYEFTDRRNELFEKAKELMK